MRDAQASDEPGNWGQLRRRSHGDTVQSLSSPESNSSGDSPPKHLDGQENDRGYGEFVSFKAFRPDPSTSQEPREHQSPQPQRSRPKAALGTFAVERPSPPQFLRQDRGSIQLQKEGAPSRELGYSFGSQEAPPLDLEKNQTYPKPRVKAGKYMSRRERYEMLDDESQTLRHANDVSKKKRSKQSRREDDDEEDYPKGRDLKIDGEDIRNRELKRERKKLRKQEKAQDKVKASGPQIILPDFISIGNLASALKVRIEDFAHKLIDMGFDDVSHHHIVDGETAGLIAEEMGFRPIIPSKDSQDDIVALPPPTDTTFLMSRPPIVTIMGHVDHGKTTLLDWLRKSSIAASEHGGITQHIGAFTVQMSSGRSITFLDTPGHAAFLEMRARGANVTDIVILVVAADDSVKPQTIEAIKHARAAKVSIIVAISKMDKEDANAERVKQDLARQGVEVEDFGGDTQTVCVSGKTGLGMEELEESTIALADVLDVKADTTGQVEGWVLEATSKKSGKAATVLVRRGTLAVGDVLVAGQTWTRVKTLRNEAGVLVDSALPGTPVEVDGWREQPDAGAEVLQALGEQQARRAVEVRVNRAESEKLAADVVAMNEARKAEEAKREREKAIENEDSNASSEEFRTQSTPGLTEVPFVLRADVSGSVGAIEASVLALGNSEVRPSILRSSFGPLSENDIDFAATAGGHVLSFNQPVDGIIKRMAEQMGVKVLDGNIIYRLTDDVKAILEDRLPPLITNRVTGEAEIAQVFEINLKGKKKLPVAGCKVRNGTIAKGSKVTVLRDKEVLYDGESNLRCPRFLFYAGRSNGLQGF